MQEIWELIVGTVANSVLDIASDVKDVEDERDQLALDNAAIRAELATASTALTIAESLLTGNAEEIARLNVRITELEALLAGGEDPDPEPDPELPRVPTTGYNLAKTITFATNPGMRVYNNSRPSNSGATRMTGQAQFGRGPDGTSLLLVAEYNAAGTLVTGEVTTEGYYKAPSLHHRRTVIEYPQAPHKGVTPAVWDRDADNGRTEFDDVENFGLKAANDPQGSQAPSAGGLHLRTYESGHPHKAIQFRFPLSYWQGKHVLDARFEPTKITVWVDGVKQGELLKSQFVAADWNEMLVCDKWLRWCIQANPGTNVNLTGTLPADFEKFEMYVHSVEVYTPA